MPPVAEGAEGEEVPLERPERVIPEQEVQGEDPAVRGIYLRRGDFKQHGWTNGCAKCQFMILHPSREGGPVHTDSCKRRIIEELRSHQKEADG